MKLTIESCLNCEAQYSNYIGREYLIIIDEIVKSLNDDELRAAMIKLDLQYFMYFKWGFGSNHMWVKQILPNNKLGDRLIFVEL